jgi:hypothetical protein
LEANILAVKHSSPPFLGSSPYQTSLPVQTDKVVDHSITIRMSAKDSYASIKSSLNTLKDKTALPWTRANCGLQKSEVVEGTWSIDPWEEPMQGDVETLQSNYDIWCDRLIALENEKGKTSWFTDYKKASDDGELFGELSTQGWRDVADDKDLDQYRKDMRTAISTFETDLQAQKGQANVVLANAGQPVLGAD